MFYRENYLDYRVNYLVYRTIIYRVYRVIILCNYLVYRDNFTINKIITQDKQDNYHDFVRTR